MNLQHKINQLASGKSIALSKLWVACHRSLRTYIPQLVTRNSYRDAIKTDNIQFKQMLVKVVT